LNEHRVAQIRAQFHKARRYQIRHKRVRKLGESVGRIFGRKVISLGERKYRAEMKRQISVILRRAGKNPARCFNNRAFEKQTKQNEKENVIKQPEKFLEIRAVEFAFSFSPVASNLSRFVFRVSNSAGKRLNRKESETVTDEKPKKHASRKQIKLKTAEPTTLPALKRHKSGSSLSKR
jgi:hypothetical protein